MQEHKVTGRQYNSKTCFVCGLENEFGLKARFYDTAEGEVVAVFSTLNGHQSYPGRLHGGVISAILDETMGRAVCIGQGNESNWGVTVELNVSYKKPVPLECELKAVGRLTQENRRIFHASGELLLPDGTVAAVANGVYMKFSIESIAGRDSEFMANEWGLKPPEEMPGSVEY